MDDSRDKSERPPKLKVPDPKDRVWCAGERGSYRIMASGAIYQVDERTGQWRRVRDPQ